MALYEYLILDSVSGDALEQVPLNGVSYSNGLNGTGTFSGSIPLTHPKANRSLLQTISREILVMREGVPVWNGPITQLSASGGSVQISAAPVWWYMTKRTLELGRNYVNLDLSQIFDDIMSTVNGKFLGDIRLTKTTPFTMTGQLRTQAYDATSRKYAAEAIGELAQIYPGFDWMVNLRLDATTGKVLREYQVYPGFKGVLVDQTLTARNTVDVTDVDDGTRIFNRVHELGAGSGNTQLIVSRSAYEPDAYFDYGEYLTGWSLGGTPTVDSVLGNPAPSFSLTNGQHMSRSYPHGVGSVIEFDYYHEAGSTVSAAGQANNSGLFYFGATSGGSGMAWASHVTSGSVDGMGIVSTGSLGAPGSSPRVSNRALVSGQWYRVRIKIVSSTVAWLYLDGVQVQGWNGSIFVYDFPITLQGTTVGAAGLGATATYGRHHFDNMTVPQATSTYTNPGIPYIEEVVGRTDVTDLKSLQFYAQADLFLGRWPNRTFTVSYRPSASLPYGFATPGDTVALDIQNGYINATGQKRVISIPVTVEAGGGEKIDLIFNEIS